MDNLIAAGKAKPFIVVMANSYVPGAASGPGRGAPGGGRGFNFSAFEHLLLDDLIPYIDANFRTMVDQPHRAMAGLSMGGMQTRTIAMAHLDTFSHIGIFSGGSIAAADIANMAAFKPIWPPSRRRSRSCSSATEAARTARPVRRTLRP